MRSKHFILLFLMCCAPLLLAACGGTPSVANRMTEANANAPQTAANQQPVAPVKKTDGGGGDPVDTSKTDAEIKRLEKEIEKKPDDAKKRRALAEAYLERAKALTDVRQYRAALGDYRRTLRYDPDNAYARQMSGTIVNILQGMGRDIPAEGAEPTPLPMPSKAK